MSRTTANQDAIKATLKKIATLERYEAELNVARKLLAMLEAAEKAEAADPATE